MIKQSPESDMPEPFRTYVAQRSLGIAQVLGDVIGERNVQLCPRAVLPNELIFWGEDLVYGAVVSRLSDGYKSVLYNGAFSDLSGVGICTDDIDHGFSFAREEFRKNNTVRIKNPIESDGNGQHVIEHLEDFESSFIELSLECSGEVVVMPNIDLITKRVSIGSIDLGRDGEFTYMGREKQVLKNGVYVYGGTKIGLFEANDSDMQEEVEICYDIPTALSELGKKAIELYKGIALKTGRVSFDIIRGETWSGQEIDSVIDITPRVGGVTPAEVLAIKYMKDKGNHLTYSESRLLFEPEFVPITGPYSVNFVDTNSLIINASVTGAI